MIHDKLKPYDQNAPQDIEHKGKWRNVYFGLCSKSGKKKFHFGRNSWDSEAEARRHAESKSLRNGWVGDGTTCIISCNIDYFIPMPVGDA